MSDILELSTITLKDSFPSPPQSLLDDLQILASTPGLIALYFGQHLETPTNYTWVAHWSSQSAIDSFHASPGFASWAASYAAPLATYAVSTSTAYTGDAAVPLEAPCTEFFSNFGADDDFLEKRLTPFLNLIVDAKLPGLVGGITGELVPVVHVGVDEPESKTVLLLLGWNAKADHTAQKGEGKCMLRYLRHHQITFAPFANTMMQVN